MPIGLPAFPPDADLLRVKTNNLADFFVVALCESEQNDLRTLDETDCRGAACDN